MRTKYIDQIFGYWIQFGLHKGSTVDLADQEDSSLIPGISPELCEFLCHNHNLANEVIAELLQELAKHDKQKAKEIMESLQGRIAKREYLQASPAGHSRS